MPKYVIKLLSRARYNYASEHKDYTPGYTINIAKKSQYQKIDSFQEEIQRFTNWANRELKAKAGGESEICAACVLQIPIKTTYYYDTQYATLNIFDPIMRSLEPYINE